MSPQILTLARTCAPDVHPLTVAYLVSAESHNNPFAINVNGGHSLERQPTTEQEARDAIARLDARGWNYDVGYAQINSANFRRLGVTGAQVLDACTNLRAGAQVLGDCYSRAVQQVGAGQAALQRALSCYNTGNQQKGFANGYVKRVVAQVKLKIPALLDGPIDPNVSSNSSASNAAAAAGHVPSAAQLSQQQNPPPSNVRTQLGESGAAGQIEAGAFAHPEIGAYLRRTSTKERDQ
ncbi:lytic transglycosylase domain-containing protein [Paraburkholderia azotifigens]|uniref:Lytic transglycosylase domain-containing protein n=1 Tax=Paraburkholderia azotifigens TaxID=2057004 RepID=A0A5C6VKZ3_9BURK|nr:lytic transglycosylase domain-containing protein [Paraburkholderia azotifigens]TXC85481.1 lytic transglycosylase domain-containing protein [Paraburkholderia azotifigens]